MACQETLAVSDNPCIIYTGESIPQVNLIKGNCYPLFEILEKLWAWIMFLAGGGTTSTTTSTTSTTTSSTTTTTTTLVFNTELTFASSTSDFDQGVGGQAIAVNPNLKFEFNFISPVVGLYNIMNISVASVPILQITYRSEYTGNQFRVTDINGITHLGVFNGDVNFQ